MSTENTSIRLLLQTPPPIGLMVGALAGVCIYDCLPEVILANKEKKNV